jgi:hypothetical protein
MDSGGIVYSHYEVSFTEKVLRPYFSISWLFGIGRTAMAEVLESTLELLEAHFTLSELSKKTGLSIALLRTELSHFPGVLRIARASLRHKRGYVSIRVPVSVFRKWHQGRAVSGIISGAEVS